MPLWLARLGTWHGKRFDRRGEPEDINKAIEWTTIALTMTPDDDPGLTGLLDKLTEFHGDRFQRLGDMDDSNKELEYASIAVSLTPDGHPELPRRLSNIGVAHTNRYKQMGELGDLENAIEYDARALALTSNDDMELPHRLYILGISYSDRFERLGDLHDIEKAIEGQARAVVLTPNGDPNLSNRLGSLAVSHSNRFNRLGELGDLEKAIEYESRALGLTPDGHPRLSRRLQNLGRSHSYRFKCLGELGDLEKAIEYQSRALELTPDGHPTLSARLDNLGVSHIHRFKHLDELGDVDKAIEYQSHALALTPDGHPDQPNHLHNLGVSHAHRFGQLHMQHDLEKVIECMSCALVLTPHGHPTLPDKHFPLAVHRLHQYRLTGDISQLQHSLISFRIASQSMAGSPRNKFKYAVRWAEFASIFMPLNPIEAYQTTINLLPQFIWFGATTHQRYHDLEQVQNLAINAATAAIAASNLELAVEWLEHGRCVVWNQNLMLRSPLDQLHASQPTLAIHLRTVADQLHHAGSESRESHAIASGSLTAEQVAQLHRQLAKQYNELISQARMLPGFEDFLQPIKANSLVQAARIGPIVVLNCHDSRCDGLVIFPEQDTIDHIPLPNFTGEKAQRIRLEMEKSLRAQGLRERGVERRPLLELGDDSASDFERVLRVLWHDVVKPVLEFLGCM
ncbi:hypothetical protein FRC11_013839, partial [Ceratobasidium sp. 423]